MACIDPDGTLTPLGLLLLKGLAEQPMPPEDIAKYLGEPLFRVRGSLRELAGAELIEEEGGLYHLTGAGQSKL
jgi:predicted transcriptional regulator